MPKHGVGDAAGNKHWPGRGAGQPNHIYNSQTVPRMSGSAPFSPLKKTCPYSRPERGLGAGAESILASLCYVLSSLVSQFIIPSLGGFVPSTLVGIHPFLHPLLH